MNWKGTATAVVFLFLVSASRLKDKPVFSSSKAQETWVKTIEDDVKAFHKARSSKLKAYADDD